MKRDVFNELVKGTRLKRNTRKMAAAVLVDGRTVASVQKEFDVHASLIYRAVNRVLNASPFEVSVVSVTVPAGREQEIRELADRMIAISKPDAVTQYSDLEVKRKIPAS